jgi:type IV pilus assembly protein PilA
VTRNGGFTMVEMMVVIGIVAILALMALPSYQDKFIRDQIVEALPLADIAKPLLASAWTTAQSFPADKIVNNFVAAVAIQDGAIQITFGNRANERIKGKLLSLRPAVVEDAPIVPVTWVCGYAAALDKMTAKGENRTNIPASLLPFRCRAA